MMETCITRRGAFMPLHPCKPRDVAKGNGKVASVVTFPRLEFDWHEYIAHLNDTILKTTGSVLFENLWQVCMVVRMRLVGAHNCNNPTANRPLFKANLPWSPYDLHFGHNLRNLSRFPPPLKGIIKSTQACDHYRKAVEKVDVGFSSELGDNNTGAKANIGVAQPSPKPANPRVVQPSPKANARVTQPSSKPSPQPNICTTQTPPKENTRVIQPPPNGNTRDIQPSPEAIYTRDIKPSKLDNAVVGDKANHDCTAPPLNLERIGQRDATPNIHALPSNTEESVDDETNTRAKQPFTLDENVAGIASLEVALSAPPSCKGVMNVASEEQGVPTHVWDPNSKQWESSCTLETTSTPPPPSSTTSTTTTTNQENKVMIAQQDVWCVHGRKMVLRNPSGRPTSPPHRGSEFLQEMGLSSHQPCQTWDLLWERGKPKKVSKLLWNILSKNLPVGASRAALEGGEEEEAPMWCGRCSEAVSVETIQHCLYDCPKASEVWGRMARLHKHLGIAEPISWGRVQLGCADVLKVHEHLQRARDRDCSPQERRRLRDLLKKMTPVYIWELVRAITLWAIWTARCSFVCYKNEVPVEVVVLRIWKELVSTAQLVQEEIMRKLVSGDPDAAHQLSEMFWVCYDYKDTIFRKGNQGKLLWFKSPPLWLLHPA